MKTVVIANPKAAAGRVGRDFSRINDQLTRAFGPLETRLTQGPGGATLLARRAVEEGVDRIVAVGGDGTLNEVVNGFASADGTWLSAKTELALAPVGTGGDFARSVGLSGVPLDRAYIGAAVRPIDIGRAVLEGPDGAPLTRYFANISSFGSSGLVVDRVNRTSKRLGAKLSFLAGTVRGLLAYENQRVRLRIDDHFDEELVINTVAVANGRFFGGSMKIAPGARLDDGLFEIVIVGDIGLVQFLRYSPALYKGQHLEKRGVRRLSGRVVQAEPFGHSPVLIDLDGEQPGRLPVRYEVVPGALRLCAPFSQAEAV